MHISETRWAYPYRVRGNSHDFVWAFLVLAPASFCNGSFSLLAKRKSGRQICVSSLLPGFCFSFCFLHGFASFLKPRVSYLHIISPLLSSSGPSLRARSAATEEKKLTVCSPKKGALSAEALAEALQNTLRRLRRF